MPQQIQINPPSKFSGPHVLFWGSALWRGIGHLSNIDFLMSIQTHRLKEAFEWFYDYGSFALPVLALVWGYGIKKRWIARPSWKETVLVIALIAFLWGVLVALMVTDKVPRTIVGWGTDPRLGGCLATLDVSSLQRFKDKYDVAMMCGVRSPSVDRLTDKTISISNKFNIPPNNIDILAQFSDQMKASTDRRTIWFMTVLIPKEIDMPVIHSLADVRKYRGKIIESGYFD